MIQNAKEKTVNHLFICGEPAWLAELASLTSDPFLAGKPLVAWRNVSGYNDLQREKSKKVS